MKFDAGCLASCPHLCLHVALGADCRLDITHLLLSRDESDSVKALSCQWTFMYLLALPTTKALKDIVFRFIIEYSSSKDLGPYVIDLFLYEDFQMMIFWACVES